MEMEEEMSRDGMHECQDAPLSMLGSVSMCVD